MTGNSEIFSYETKNDEIKPNIRHKGQSVYKIQTYTCIQPNLVFHSIVDHKQQIETDSFFHECTD